MQTTKIKAAFLAVSATTLLTSGLVAVNAAQPAIASAPASVARERQPNDDRGNGGGKRHDDPAIARERQPNDDRGGHGHGSDDPAWM